MTVAPKLALHFKCKASLGATMPIAPHPTLPIRIDYFYHTKTDYHKMKLIIPMAGRGSRLRPHTLTVPKPVVPIAGKPIVERLAETLTNYIDGTFEEIAFIIGDFGPEIEEQLLGIANKLGSTGKIYYQENPQGPAHAIHCAKDSIDGPCIVAFADTLFYGDFDLNTSADGLIWTKQVEDPSAYGVVLTDENQMITGFEEKPTAFISDLAIVGIYYFKNGDRMKTELCRVIDEDMRYKGEFQITTVLENLNESGYTFGSKRVDEWLDCGNKDALVHANKRVLDIEDHRSVYTDVTIEDSCIIQPCHIGSDVTIVNSVIGPHVSIGSGTRIERSIIENSVIQNSSEINHVNIKDSMIGNHTKYIGKTNNISIGDYSQLEA